MNPVFTENLMFALNTFKADFCMVLDKVFYLIGYPDLDHFTELALLIGFLFSPFPIVMIAVALCDKKEGEKKKKK